MMIIQVLRFDCPEIMRSCGISARMISDCDADYYHQRLTTPPHWQYILLSHTIIKIAIVCIATSD